MSQEVKSNETEITEDDEEALIGSEDAAKQPRIIYDILHSPSYQVPILYLTFKDLQRHAGRKGSLPSLDELYDLLIPPAQRPQMQHVGVMGALSMTDHPISNAPAYFVHPCRTAEAMDAVTGGHDVKPEEYLLMWLGMVGPSVGLTVPVEVVQKLSKSSDA